MHGVTDARISAENLPTCGRVVCGNLRVGLGMVKRVCIEGSADASVRNRVEARGFAYLVEKCRQGALGLRGCCGKHMTR